MQIVVGKDVDLLFYSETAETNIDPVVAMSAHLK